MRHLSLFGSLAMLAAVLTALPAFATTTQWTLVGVTNDGGGTLTGTFDFNPLQGPLGTFTNVDITDTWNAHGGGGLVWDTSEVTLSSNVVIQLDTPPNMNLGDYYFQMELDFGNGPNLFSSLDDIYKQAVDGPEYYINYNDVLLQTFWNGYVVPTATCGPLGCTAITPIPAALPLFASGLGAMGLLGWRRKRKNIAAIAA
jgi:hypothetical protein